MYLTVFSYKQKIMFIGVLLCLVMIGSLVVVVLRVVLGLGLLRTRQAASAAVPLTAPPGTRAGPRLPTRCPTLAVTCRWDPGHPPGCGVGSDRCGFDLHLPADKWVFFMCLLATCVSLGKF